jgi:putative SOS response-associated peptidase YedK
MCGRYANYTSFKELAKYFGVPEITVPENPRYNIAPTQDVAAVRMSPEGEGRELAMLRWGLIPHWAKDPAIGSKTFNARAETVAEKPSFREPFKRRRCLIPADGFYEWRRRGDRKQPHYFYMSDGEPFAFAGLWDSWRNQDGEGEQVESCTIITTTPNELLSSYHDRMPVILKEADYDLWLDADVSKPALLTPLLRPVPADLMSSHPVSLLVNGVRTDEPSCIEPKAL